MDNNLFDNDALAKLSVKNSIILYDIKNNIFKKKYISNEDSGKYSDYSAKYIFHHGIMRITYDSKTDIYIDNNLFNSID